MAGAAQLGAAGRDTPSRFDTSAFEPSGFDFDGGGDRWIGWRRRALVAVALIGCLGVFLVARWLAATPWIDATWAADAAGRVQLLSSPLPELRERVGHTLVGMGAPGAAMQPVDAQLLHRSPRWQVDDGARARQIAQHDALAAQLAQGAVALHFDGGSQTVLRPRTRGLAGLGLLFWPLAALALTLLLFAAVVVLARPGARQAMFAVMAFSQAGNLLFIAIETTRGLGLPLGAGGWDLPVRLALDLATAAAAVQAFALSSRPQGWLPWGAPLAWGVALLGSVLAAAGWLRPTFWWAQGLCLALGVVAWAALRRPRGAEPDALALVMRRLCLLALATLVLATLAVAASARLPGVAHGVAMGASVAWYLFLASLLLLSPFLARSRPLLREFALLAGISTVAASVDLLFVAVFSVGAFTSLALAVFVALAVYAAARQAILQHLLGGTLLTTERTFEHLYRAARELQARPGRHAQVFAQLLQELLEPLQLQQVTRMAPRARVLGGGSALIVPLPGAEGHEVDTGTALLLRHAQRGRRLFTLDDARLAGRLAEQLRRAVAYDQAVERGRAEERQRLAQDLHDDIGARLLTLMYQAPTPEIEDYIRHTLQDLKTLTRGLAAAEHRLSDAAAEWKADLGQRMAAAQAELAWAFSADDDPRLTMVQWSSLTRVLRELVSNALYHGHASRIEVSLQLQGQRLALSVADDGDGQSPEAWSHGLGLGGVRKRVKLLGGQVLWRVQSPRGIACDVRVDRFGSAGAST